MDYVQRVKTCFSNDPDTYKQLLEVLVGHESSADNVRLCYYVLPDYDVSLAAKVFARAQELLKDAPDLAFASHDFLPGIGSMLDSDSWVCGGGRARDLGIRDANRLVEYMRSYERIGAWNALL